jgi:hypothetical protein
MLLNTGQPPRARPLPLHPQNHFAARRSQIVRSSGALRLMFICQKGLADQLGHRLGQVRWACRTRFAVCGGEDLPVGFDFTGPIRREAVSNGGECDPIGG